MEEVEYRDFALAIGAFIVILSCGFITACIEQENMLLFCLVGAIFLVKGLKIALDGLTQLQNIS